MKRCSSGVYAVILAVGLLAFKIESIMYTTATYEYVGSDFAMGDNSESLDDDVNWKEAAPSCADGENKVYFCKTTVVYQFVKPTKEQLRNAIKAEYDRIAAFNMTFTDGYTFNVSLNSEIVSIQVFLKCTS